MAAHATTRAPLPPTSEPTTAFDTKPPPSPPPPPLSADESDAPPKKRKLEELGFHDSPYYRIREAVVNLRGRFLQVCRATDSQKNGVALEILKEIKVVMELSKRMRLDISAAAEPAKPSDIPAVRDVKNKPAGKVPSGGKNQVPQIGQDTGEKVPLKPVSSQTPTEGFIEKPIQGRRQTMAISCWAGACMGLMSLVDLPWAGIFSCGLEVKQSTMA